MKIFIITQIYENYGAHDWDGKGECPQYWKAKGGNEYFIPYEGPTISVEFIETAVDSVRGKIEENNHYFTETILDWTVVEDDYQTDYEKFQLEYEGKINYPAKILRRNADFEWEFTAK
jgi:hypothetical protein